MRTQKLLVLVSAVAVIGGSSLQAQPADSQASPQMNSSRPGSGIHDPVPTPTTRLTREQYQQVLDELHRIEAEMDAKDGVPPCKLSREDDQKIRETLHQAEADMDARAKAAAESAAAEKDAAKMAAERKAQADKAAADKAAAEAAALHQSVAPPETPASAVAVNMVPGSKEQRLFDLLQLYKADKISPTEYHEQRAKIVAEP